VLRRGTLPGTRRPRPASAEAPGEARKIAAAKQGLLHQARRTSRIGGGLRVGPEPINTVPKEGLEPSHPKAQEPKSCVSANSTTPAVLNCFAPLSADRALGVRLLRRHSQTIMRVCSHLLSTAARDPVFDCLARCARSARIALGTRLLRRRSPTKKRVASLRIYCSLRSLRLALVSRCLPRSQTKGMSARSSRTAPRQPLSTAARDPGVYI
jgi:hypothetical protein